MCNDDVDVIVPGGVDVPLAEDFGVYDEVFPDRFLSRDVAVGFFRRVFFFMNRGYGLEHSWVCAGGSRVEFSVFYDHYLSDVDDGVGCSFFVDFLDPLLVLDALGEGRVVDVVMGKALDGDLRACEFLLRERYGWGKVDDDGVGVDDGGVPVLNFRVKE